MDFIVQQILPYILIYKYLGIFVITFFAAIAIPIPAGTLLVAAAAFASQGYFNFLFLFTVVFIANITGDSLAYFIARKYGTKVLSKISFFRKILKSNDYILIEKSIHKNPGFIIFISRFEVLSTITLNILCGISKIRYKKFLFFELIGTFSYVTFYGMLGYYFGDSWQSINDLMGNFSILFLLFVILLVSFFWKKIMSRLKNNLNNDI